MQDITDEQLRIAVAASRSWRGVLRTLGRTSPRTGRELKARCDVLGIDYRHFGAGVPTEEDLRAAVVGSESWPEVLGRLGYSPQSGSARATLRRRCAGLALDTAHLTAGPGRLEAPWQEPRSLAHLPSAAPMLVAGVLTLVGHRVSWPLEPAPYDLLTELAGAVHRIQVKATRSTRDGAWVCSLTHTTYDPELGRSVPDVYTADQVDAFGIVDGDLRVYVVPLDVVAGRKSVNVRHYERFRLPLTLSA